MIEYNQLFIEKFIKKQLIKWNLLALISFFSLCTFFLLLCLAFTSMLTITGSTTFAFIFFTAVSFFIFGQASLWSIILFKENKLYKNTNDFIPNSLNKYFLFLHVKKYIFNWFLYPAYIIGIISALLMLLIDKNAGPHSFWNGFELTIPKIPSLKTYYISLCCIIFVVFLIHIITLFFDRKKISDIKNQVKSENLPSTEDIRTYEKKINRRCLITFCIIFIILLIPLVMWAIKNKWKRK